MKKSNRIYFAIGILIVLVIAILMISNQKRDEEVIKIGWIGPLTGPAAF